MIRRWKNWNFVVFKFKLKFVGWLDLSANKSPFGNVKWMQFVYAHLLPIFLSESRSSKICSSKNVIKLTNTDAWPGNCPVKSHGGKYGAANLPCTCWNSRKGWKYSSNDTQSISPTIPFEVHISSFGKLNSTSTRPSFSTKIDLCRKLRCSPLSLFEFTFTAWSVAELCSTHQAA